MLFPVPQPPAWEKLSLGAADVTRAGTTTPLAVGTQAAPRALEGFAGVGWNALVQPKMFHTTPVLPCMAALDRMATLQPKQTKNVCELQ